MASEWFSVIVVLVAGLSIGVGVALPAIGQARAASHAMEALARQPEEAGTISRALYIGLAMIESLALYVLIVVLVLLFANPLEAGAATAARRGPAAFWLLAGSVVAAAAAITIGIMLAAVGQGRVTAAALTAIAEQPEARDTISTSLFISLALLESLALYALIVSLVLLFANPLIGRVPAGG
jgi:F-type H+-transporting ATPase subunit c